MAPVLTAALIPTKWGPAIEFEGKLIHLHYPGHVDELEMGKQYTCEIFLHIWFAQAPWTYLESNTLEGLARHPGFTQYQLDISQARMHFELKL